MTNIHEKKDSLKEHEEVVQGMRKQRRLKITQKKDGDYNQTH